MKIAHILPASTIFPLTKHNGRYEWAIRLARLQAMDGHDVVIYSGTNSCNSEPKIGWQTTKTIGVKNVDNRNLFRSALSDPQIEIFHSHFDSLGGELADETNRPVITTQHWFPNAQIADNLNKNQSGNSIVVPVTNYMARKDSELGIKTSGVIYHGIDLDLFHPVDKPDSERMIFVGRITQGKGVREAVEYAIRAKAKLDIVGKINDKDLHYWQSFADKIDGDNIIYHGPKSQTEVAAMMANAKAVIFPSKVPEAFGQVTIEAQACGTPVIISDVGASHELVVHGETGMIASNGDEFVKFMTESSSISRSACRKFAERFSIEGMVKKYYNLYLEVSSRN